MDSPRFNSKTFAICGKEIFSTHIFKCIYILVYLFKEIQIDNLKFVVY